MKSTLTLSIAVFLAGVALAGTVDDTKSRMNAETFKGLELRSIGPAFMSGRIADLEAARAEAADLGEELLEAGAPWVEGNRLPE